MVSMNFINLTLVIHKVNMFSKSNLLKLNLITCHGNVIHEKRNEDISFLP